MIFHGNYGWPIKPVSPDEAKEFNSRLEDTSDMDRTNYKYILAFPELLGITKRANLDRPFTTTDFHLLIKYDIL